MELGRSLVAARVRDAAAVMLSLTLTNAATTLKYLPIYAEVKI